MEDRTMKKTYQNPETTIVTVQMGQMIAASTDGFNGALGTQGGSGSNALGRGSQWDDDEE